MILISGLTFCEVQLGEDGRKVGTCVALKGSKSRRNQSCLVFSFNDRLLLLQLRV